MAKKIILTKNHTNYYILGLISNMPDHKTAWLINNFLNTKFTKYLFETEFLLDFSFFINQNNPKLILIENKQKTYNKILFNELKKFDFIIKLYVSESEMNEIYNKLKIKIEFQSIFKIDSKLLTQKNQHLLKIIDYEL